MPQSIMEESESVAGAFGSYGWSGEAVDNILLRLKSLKLRVPPLEPLKIKLIPSVEELQKCFDFGVEFAQIINGKMIEMDMA